MNFHFYIFSGKCENKLLKNTFPVLFLLVIVMTSCSSPQGHAPHALNPNDLTWSATWESAWKNKTAKDGYLSQENSSLWKWISSPKKEAPPADPDPVDKSPDYCNHSDCKRNHSNKKDHDRYHKKGHNRHNKKNRCW